MLERNVKFLDLYKSVDRFIRDAYRTPEGVSEYIRQMEQNSYNGCRYVPTWKADYESLKHVRWIRNQLSHEVGYDSDICEASDYAWLESFYNRLYSANDPMAVLNRTEESERKRWQEYQRSRLAAQRERQKQDAAAAAEQQGYVPSYPIYRKTVWQRIRDFFSRK